MQKGKLLKCKLVLVSRVRALEYINAVVPIEGPFLHKIEQPKACPCTAGTGKTETMALAILCAAKAAITDEKVGVSMVDIVVCRRIHWCSAFRFTCLNRSADNRNVWV